MENLQQQVNDLEKQLKDMKFKMDFLIKEDKYLFQRDVEFLNNARIGQKATTKLGFYGLTPLAQPSSTGESSGATAGGGTGLTHLSTFTGNNGSTAYTILDIVKHLKNLGLLLK